MKNKLSIGLIITMIAGALLFGLKGMAVEMGLFVAACGVALAFANIDKIQRFKGAGFEAEMKKAVEDAYATVELLKSIAKPLILSILSNLIYANRFGGGMKKEQQHKLKDDMDHLAKLIGVFDNEVQSESEKFFAWNAIDIIQRLESVVQKVKPLEEPERNAIYSLIDRDTDKYPNIEELRQVMDSLDKEQKEAAKPVIDDYEYYLSNRAIRRPGVQEE